MKVESFEQLERELAAWAGYPPECMVCCASGSAALHLSLESFQLPLGSEVVTSDFNMIAVPRACSLAGLTPVFVDCTDDLLIDPSLVKKRLPEAPISPAYTRGIIATHIYGRRCPMTELTYLCGKHGLFLIEDLAEAHGVKPHPQTDAACWSFFRNKEVAGSEGGAVAFRNPEHAAIARELRCLGFTAAHDFVHRPRGVNARMSNAHAELILPSLRNFTYNQAARRQIEAWYDAACPEEWRMPPRQSVWVFDVKIPGLTRAKQGEIVRALNSAGIAARHSFMPMSAQEEYRHCRVVGNGNAARLAECVLYLPVQPGVTAEADARRSFEIIRAALPS